MARDPLLPRNVIRAIDDRSIRAMKSFASFLTLALLAGCATAPDFPAPNDRWESFTGQLQYATPERSVVGEFTAARHGEDFRLEFSKGGAVTLLKLAGHGGFIRAEGPLAHGRWHGRADAAPAYLQGWVAVPTGFASLGKNSRIPRTGIHPEATFDREHPNSLTIPGARAGEKLTFHFNR
jgi:hypothetical protein